MTVRDDCESLIAGVNVTGTFAGDFSETITAVTNGSGVATLTTLSQIRKPSYTFCVDVLTGAWPYIAGDNGETCDTQ